MASLQQFHKDVETRDNVKEYLLECLKSKMVEVGFEKGDTKPIAEAKEIIDEAFDKMDIMFRGKIEEKVKENPAR